MVENSGIRNQGSGIRVQGSGFRVEGFDHGDDRDWRPLSEQQVPVPGVGI
jgi:hypothetical protein